MWLVAAFAQAHFNNGKLFMVLLFMVTVSVSVFFFCELTFCLYLACKLREYFIHLKDHRETWIIDKYPRNHYTLWRCLKNVLKDFWRHIQRNNFSSSKSPQKDLEEEKLLRFIMKKLDNHFLMSLDFAYVLHLYNGNQSHYITKLLNACT